MLHISHTQPAMFGFLLLLVAMVDPSAAQHLGDVEIVLDGNRLSTRNESGNNRIYVNEFDNLAGTLFTDDPGFESQSGSLPGGISIGFNVTQSLWYWDGERLAPPPLDASIKITLGPVSPVFVTGTSDPQPGFHFATTSASGTIHTHLSYTLSPGNAAFGMYGIVLELTSPSYEESEPCLLAFNYGLSDLEEIDAGVEAIALASGVVDLPAVPGDTDDDGDVDLTDLNNVRNFFGQTGDPVLGDTLPFDGTVDLSDLNNVRNHFGVAMLSRAVPEPTSGAICLFTIAAMAWGFRRDE